MADPARPLRLAKLFFPGLVLLASVPAAAANDEPRPMLLETRVNGQEVAEPQLFLRGPSGGTYVSEATLREWRLELKTSDQILFEGEVYRRIDAHSGIRMKLDEASQTITIDAVAESFQRQQASLGLADDLEMTPAGTGGFLSYDAFAEHSSGQTSLSGSFEIGAFTEEGVVSTTFVSRIGGGKSQQTRLETSWTIDRPGPMNSIRIGDAVSRGGSGSAPVRFGGIQFARNFSVQPGFVTMPLPTLEGSAAVPSVIDIFVNGSLQGSREVSPGPFSISQVPIQSGGGNVQLVVRDILGREVVSSQAYYGSRELLRPGLSDYSYEAGFLRRDFGRASNLYGTAMVAATQRYGFTSSFTGEAHLEISGKTQMASIGAVALAGNVGVISGSAAFSRSDRGAGTQLAAGIERRTASYSGGIRAEYSTPDFTFVGAGDLHAAPRFKSEAFFDLALMGGTSIGLNYLRRDSRNNESESLAGLFANLSLGRFGTVQLYARHSEGQSRATMFGGTLSLSFGRGASALASVELINERLQTQYSYQTAAAPGIGGSWRSNASLGETRSIGGGYNFNASFASLNVEAARARGHTGVRASASGAVGLVGGTLFTSRRLGSSFAAVEIPGYKGVRVYADNQLIGVTDDKGVVIIPAMRAFERNKIRVEEADLPLDVQLASFEHVVRPFARSGTVVSFVPRKEKGVLMRVQMEDGTPLPLKASARIEGAETQVVTLPGGELYVAALPDEARVTVDLESGTCSFQAKVTDMNDPQPVLEGLVCRRVHVYPPA